MSESFFQLPPIDVLQLADYTPPPTISMDMHYEHVIYCYRNAYKSLEDLMQPEVRLAGRRVNPQTRLSTSIDYIRNIKIGKTDSAELIQVEGLPQNMRIAYTAFSPDERFYSFTNVTDKGLELWIINIKEAKAKKLIDARLNAFLGDPIAWFADSKRLIVRLIPENPKIFFKTENKIPKGPVIIESSGETTQNRTYQDLLKNETDSHNFEALALSELYIVDINGNKTLFREQDLYKSVSTSPDGNYILINVLQKPFSYLVPESRFANSSIVFTSKGEFVKTIEEAPVNEILPKGIMAVHCNKRDIYWRADLPATLSFVLALDGGDPANECDFRDALYCWDAPFTDEPRLIFKVPLRISGVLWHDGELACVTDVWYDSRRTCTYLISPDYPNRPVKKLYDRNYQDIYSFPGNFELARNKYGRYVLILDNRHLYLVSEGYTENGKFPYIDKFNIDDLSTSRIYQSEYTDKLEEIILFEDYKGGNALVRIQSADEFPNFYIRNIKENTLKAITNVENPFKSLKNVEKKILKYKRSDGIELTATLYLPENAKAKNEKLPLLIWAYPVEYKDKSSTGQTTANPNEFIYPNYGTFIYWVMRGYAVLDDASFPIVGEGETEPNDTFLQQLIQNAQAAIDVAGKTGLIDTERVGIGGHSYGAFMVANLLTHTNLFKCGVARSGAYNRTLTPFGFQGEQRNYWDAKAVYDELSPFRYAEKMKTPLLLVHGEDDNNSGTYTMQTERYFQALKGLGAPVRMVILPKEKHSYAARENILHLLWEQDRFFEKYLKR
jgi:dipeptidyl aminopeptidase/acylaminoacyl peptidase